MTRLVRSEGGSATVLVVAMAGVLLFVMVGLATAGGLVTAQRRAQSAADLAALGGAAALDDACGEAERIAAANSAVLDGCEVAGSEVTVVVSVAGPHLPGRGVRVSAEGRAGPGVRGRGPIRACRGRGQARRRGGRPRPVRASR